MIRNSANRLMHISHFECQLESTRAPQVIFTASTNYRGSWEKNIQPKFLENGFTSTVLYQDINPDRKSSVEDYVKELRSAISRNCMLPPIIITHGVSSLLALYYLESYPAQAAIFLGPHSINSTLPFLKKWMLLNPPKVESSQITKFPMTVASNELECVKWYQSCFGCHHLTVPETSDVFEDKNVDENLLKWINGQGHNTNTVMSLGQEESIIEDGDCAPSHFEEITECMELISNFIASLSNLKTSNSDLETECEEVIFNKLAKIFEKYQEQPYLLDKQLENIITPIVDYVQKTVLSQYTTLDVDSKMETRLNRVFKILYLLTKVRGHKTILKFFTHEASDFECILGFIDTVDKKRHDIWEMRYVLLLWLSLVSLIPFDLSVLDSSTTNHTIVQRVIILTKEFLVFPGKESDASAFVIARLLARRDVMYPHLQNFIQWCSTEMSTDHDNVFLVRGILTALCGIYKYGPREALQPTLMLSLKCLSEIEPTSIRNNTLLRKLCIKLYQKLGLGFLKPKIAPWRYQRGKRSLQTNMEFSGKSPNIDEIVLEEDDDGMCEEVEEIIGLLLEGLRDKDTIVRWSAAKGIGRITERLTKELAQDVIESVVEMFAEDSRIITGKIDISGVSDATWHGSCLALAELSRRGLLLPDKLEISVPWVILALKFDQRKGSYSIGSHVRDAACYVCWSFARAYAPEVLKPHVTGLAKELVTVSIFDREVNIRRASAAAFQENVGRHGLFPHGIDIVQYADYFSVGNRVNAFMEVAKIIGNFDEYKYHLIDHLSENCVGHWDKNIRELCSKSLSNLVDLDSEYMFHTVMPTLVKRAKSTVLNDRHGGLLSVAEVSISIASIYGETNKKWYLDSEKVPQVEEIISILLDYPKPFLKTFGSEIVRQACCRLISCLSKSEWPLVVGQPQSKETLIILKSFWEIINTSIERKEEMVQSFAGEAVLCLMGWMERHRENIDDGTFISSIVNNYIDSLANGKEGCIRRGYANAIGSFPDSCIDQQWELILVRLLDCIGTSAGSKLEPDCEVRRNAVFSLTKVCVSTGKNWRAVVSESDFNRILECLLLNMSDYSIDSRGDVGSWIREACILSVYEVMKMVLTYTPEYTNLELNTRIVNNILRQSVEKIDKIREIGGQTLLNMLYAKIDPIYSTFEVSEDVLLKTHLPNAVNWKSAASLFPVIVYVFYCKDYQSSLLEGLAVSIGGLTESLVRHSSQCLVDFLLHLPVTSQGEACLTSFIRRFQQVFKKNIRNDRVSNALLDTLDILIAGDVFERLVDSDECENILDEFLQLVKKELFKSKDVKKLGSGIKVLCGLANISTGSDSSRSFLKIVANYLVHPFPKVRRIAAEELYLVVTTSGLNSGEELEMLLLDTKWDLKVSELQTYKTQVFEMLR